MKLAKTTDFRETVKVRDRPLRDMVAPAECCVRIGSVDQHAVRVFVVPLMGRVVASLPRRLIAEEVQELGHAAAAIT